MTEVETEVIIATSLNINGDTTTNSQWTKGANESATDEWEDMWE